MLSLRQHHHPARAEHDVIVQLLTQVFVQAACLFVQSRGWVLQVIRSDDCGISTCVAAAQPAFFDHSNILDAIVLAQIVRGRQSVTASTDDDDVITFLGLGASAKRAPILCDSAALRALQQRLSSVS